jgi:ABC-type Na+ efflux pump permease subunit
LFAGPIIAREVRTAPRPPRFYVARAAYAGLFFLLMWTAWQALIGWREVREIGTLARFGGILFRVFVLLQLTLMLFFAPLAAATAVALEKDRRTFVLLLMTDLHDVEIVLGKLLASLLQIGTLLAAVAPVLFVCLLLGGVAPGQVVDALAVTAAAGLAGGSLGLLVALWRDRTFQSLALTVLLVVLALVAVEALARAGVAALPAATLLGLPLRSGFNPLRAALGAIAPDPGIAGVLHRSSLLFVAGALGGSVALNAAAVWKLRAWNPGRNEPREQREGGDESAEAVEALVEVEEVPVRDLLAIAAVGAPAGGAGLGPAPLDRARPESPRPEAGPTTGLHVPRRTHRRAPRPPRPYRRPWDNPILWRELMTRGYGARPLIIKGAYLLLVVLGVGFLPTNPWILLSLAVLSLLLVNAQGVTALTSERDTGALDLLLVTELSPKEFIYGKLYGVLYNTKEMIAPPVLLTAWMAWAGVMTAETAAFAIVDFLLLCHFAAMLGLHAAITYTNSRTAVAHSLGTIFFLMVGIGVCAFLILLNRQEFSRQLLSFLVFIGAGSVALFGSLGARNPSHAIALVALLTPFWSFYCVISLANRDFLAAFLVSVGIYGFALLAMLIPAVSSFDIALGRTNAIQG